LFFVIFATLNIVELYTTQFCASTAHCHFVLPAVLFLDRGNGDNNKTINETSYADTSQRCNQQEDETTTAKAFQCGGGSRVFSLQKQWHRSIDR
jgi:hypothetical protein